MPGPRDKTVYKANKGKAKSARASKTRSFTLTYLIGLDVRLTTEASAITRRDPYDKLRCVHMGNVDCLQCKSLQHRRRNSQQTLTLGYAQQLTGRMIHPCAEATRRMHQPYAGAKRKAYMIGEGDTHSHRSDHGHHKAPRIQ